MNKAWKSAFEILRSSVPAHLVEVQQSVVKAEVSPVHEPHPASQTEFGLVQTSSWPLCPTEGPGPWVWTLTHKAREMMR